MMPGPAPPSVEAGHNTRLGIWNEVFAKVKMKLCDKEGRQKKRNLTLGQELALKSLDHKVAKVEIMILEADKGKEFVVVDEATYRAIASDHFSKDIMASKEDMTKSQRILSSTSQAMVNIFGVGKSHSHSTYARAMDNADSQTEDPPIMKILPKTHKPPTAQSHPHSRPVVMVASGISSRAGDVISDFLEPLIILTTPRLEDKSTEEVITSWKRLPG